MTSTFLHQVHTKVTGKLLFYARAINNIMLHALNKIATTSTVNGTEETLATTKHLLNYTACNLNAKIQYIASDMILQTQSDAAYLVAPNS